MSAEHTEESSADMTTQLLYSILPCQISTTACSKCCSAIVKGRYEATQMVSLLHVIAVEFVAHP